MLKKILIVVVALIVAFIAYNLINQIIHTLGASNRLSIVAERVYRLEVKNKELKNRLLEIKSLQFIEEQARNKLGLVKPGETVIIIPDSKIKEILGSTESAKEAMLPNWLGWWRVFFR